MQFFLPSVRECVLAGSAFVINFCINGAVRLSGIYFLASLDRYGTERDKAAIPFITAFAIRNLFSPITGYLGTKFGSRLITLVGCTLAAIGIGGCFFAEDIYTVTVLWGGIFGLGFGLGTVLVPQILSEHFPNNFDKVTGIHMCSSCIAGLVLPVLGDYTTRTYGVSGSFLILSAVLLHTIPAAMILKAANNIFKKERLNVKFVDISRNPTERTEVTANSLQSPIKTELNPEPFITVMYERTERVIENKFDPFINQRTENTDDGSFVSIFSTKLEEPFRTKRIKHTESPAALHLSESAEMESKISKNSSEPIITNSKEQTECSHKPYMTKATEQIEDSLQSSMKICQDVTVNLLDKSSQELRHDGGENDKENTSIPQEDRKSALSSFSLFLDITFILMMFIQSLMTYIITTLMTVIVDAARDNGVQDHNGVHVLEALAIFDFLGRLLLGYITDSGLISKCNLSSLLFASLGVALPLFALLQGFALVMVAVSLYGLLTGLLVVVGMGIVQQYIEKEHRTMGFAAVYYLYGVMSFTQPSLIGFFRENLQSYYGLFYLLGAMSFLCSILSQLIPRTARRRNKKIPK